MAYYASVHIYQRNDMSKYAKRFTICMSVSVDPRSRVTEASVRRWLLKRLSGDPDHTVLISDVIENAPREDEK
jgi:hypothetical protein